MELRAVGTAASGASRRESNPWVQRFVARPQAQARLFCFPHAGGGASAYRAWASELPSTLEVCAIQLSGREGRLREPPLSSMAAIVETLLGALGPELDRPFAFFGHSMGAILATELARVLHAIGAPMPRHLIVSARRPAHAPDPDPPISHLDDKAFAAELNRRHGGIPHEVMQHEDLMALLLPALRADMAALEGFRPGRRPPLPDVPISVFGGADDTRAPRPDLDAWRGETTGPFRVRVFSGGHFYLAAQRDAVLDDLRVTLSPLLQASTAPEVTW